MENPYKVLGVDPGASKEEVTRAYRELLKKYHPDNFNQYENPAMQELAEEKTREIIQAYEAISSGCASYESAEPADERGGTDINSLIRRADEYLDSGEKEKALSEIEKALAMGTPTGQTDVLYAMASRAYYANDDIDTALEYIDKAISANPMEGYYVHKAEVITGKLLQLRKQIKGLLSKCRKGIKDGLIPSPDSFRGKNQDLAEQYKSLTSQYGKLTKTAVQCLHLALDKTAGDQDDGFKSIIYGMEAFINYLTLCETKKGCKERAKTLSENRSKAFRYGDRGHYEELILDAVYQDL